MLKRAAHVVIFMAIVMMAALPVLLPAANAEDGIIVIQAKKIYTAAGPVIENGRIVIEKGKITAVGRNVAVPLGARVMEAEVVMPGLIDMHTHLGVQSLPSVEENSDCNEGTNPVTPQVRALDSFNFEDPALKIGLAGGVTTIVARPGSANVVGGTSVAVKLKNAPPDQMVLMEDCDLKMAIEGNPIGAYGSRKQMPTSMMGVVYLARKAFLDAREYRKSWETYEKDKRDGKDVLPPRRDLGKEAMVRALKREIPVHIHCATASEIMSCLRLADEFNLRLSLGHCYWAYLIMDELASRKDVHFNVGPPMFFAYFDNPLQFKNCPAILANGGLKVSLQMDAMDGTEQNLRESAALCIRYGMKEDDALKAVTIRGAEAVGLEKRIGSIEPGKDADLVLLNGEPFEYLTSVERVMIDGKIEFENDRIALRPVVSPGAEPRPLALAASLKSGRPIAVKCGTLYTMAGKPIHDAVLLVRDGKIEKCGAGLAIPSGYEVVDASGHTVMPGLVSARSYLGMSSSFKQQSSVNEVSGPVFPQMDAFDAIEPQSPGFTMARNLGITSALVTPGDADVIGGQGSALKTCGSVIDKMVFRKKAVMVFGFGVKAKRSGQMPSTRMGIAGLLRETLVKAREYMAKKEQAGKGGKGPDFQEDAAMEALVPVLRRETPVMVHAEREDDIRTALRIADEFGLRIVLEGATEAYKLAPELAKRDVPVILDNILRGTGNIEDRGFDPGAAAILEKAGVRIAFKPAERSWITPGAGVAGGDMLEIAAFAVKNGMSEEAALKAVTIEAARIAGIEKRVGSIEPGKDADFIILPGNPMLTRSVLEAVFIDGKVVFDSAKSSCLD